MGVRAVVLGTITATIALVILLYALRFWSEYSAHLVHHRMYRQHYEVLRNSVGCQDAVARLASGRVNNCDAADAAVAGVSAEVLSIAAGLRSMWICNKNSQVECLGISEVLASMGTTLIVLLLLIPLTLALISAHKVSTERTLTVTSPLPSLGTPAGWKCDTPLYVSRPG